jgi:hypothetical protein
MNPHDPLFAAASLFKKSVNRNKKIVYLLKLSGQTAE